MAMAMELQLLPAKSRSGGGGRMGVMEKNKGEKTATEKKRV